MQSSTKSHTLSCTMDLQSSSPCYPFPGCIQLFCQSLPYQDCHSGTLEHALCMDCGAINAPFPIVLPCNKSCMFEKNDSCNLVHSFCFAPNLSSGSNSYPFIATKDSIERWGLFCISTSKRLF